MVRFLTEITVKRDKTIEELVKENNSLAQYIHDSV